MNHKWVIKTESFCRYSLTPHHTVNDKSPYRNENRRTPDMGVRRFGPLIDPLQAANRRLLKKVQMLGSKGGKRVSLLVRK